MKTVIKWLTIFTFLLIAITGGCESTPSASGPDELDLAIRDASDYLNDNIPEGSMIVILNVQSDSAALSDYIIDELIANAVNDRIFKVVDRAQLDLIRAEQNFQLSGEVDDNLAISIGRFFGAQIIVSGTVRQLDDRYRMTIRALEVQTAQVQGQYNRNIAAGKTIVALMRGGSSSSGTSTSARTTASNNSGTVTTGGSSTSTGSRANPTVTNVTIDPDNVSVDKGQTQQFIATITGTNNPDPTVTWTVTGNTSRETSIDEDGLLTVASDEAATSLIVTVTSTVDTGKKSNANVSVPGGIAALNVNNISTWNVAINAIRNGGSNKTYIINLTGNVSIPTIDDNIFGPANGITVTILGSGTLSVSDITSNLLRIGAGQTVIVRDVTLRGSSQQYPVNNNAVVRINGGGTFRMEGSASVTGNNCYNSSASGVLVNGGNFIMQDKATVIGNINGGYNSIYVGGVYVNGGSFVMQDSASVSGNTGSECGGVAIGNGTFAMQGGTISGNTTTFGKGGGVHVANGTFTMQSGTISGNNASEGGGVYVRYNGGAFIMQNGTITGNNSKENGGGVYVANGRFAMEGGTIMGNSTSGNGGGVYAVSGNFNNVTFSKTGGTIGGNNEVSGNRNTAARQGHAVYWDVSPARWRNATYGPDDNPDDYGFWND